MATVHLTPQQVVISRDEHERLLTTAAEIAAIHAAEATNGRSRPWLTNLINRFKRPARLTRTRGS